jgi:hypothetical protein
MNQPAVRAFLLHRQGSLGCALIAVHSLLSCAIARIDDATLSARIVAVCTMKILLSFLQVLALFQYTTQCKLNSAPTLINKNAGADSQMGKIKLTPCNELCRNKFSHRIHMSSDDS